MRIDLHVHTNASDGLFAPAEVVRKAREAGLSALGIADHDTVNGVEEALQAAGEERIEVVPAVEINAYHGAFEYHILGYFLDHRDERLGRALAELREARIVRMRGHQLLEHGKCFGPPVPQCDVGGQIRIQRRIA